MLQSADAGGNGDARSICIHTLSLYGQVGVLARSLQFAVRVRSHEAGGLHRISARIVTILCHLQNIHESALTGVRFVKLDWTFPEHRYPKFTTSHSLDYSDTFGDVSFSGGLDWAQRLLDAHQSLFPSLDVAGENQDLPTAGQANLCSPPDLAPWLPLANCFEKRPGDDRLASAQEDQLSVCSDLTSATTISTPDGGCCCSNRAGMVQFPSGAACPRHDAVDRVVLAEERVQLETLARQRREAEEVYSQTGDARGLLAVLSSASEHIHSWDAFGMPRF